MNQLNEAILKLEIPDRIRSLPISDKGFPVPWFVQWIQDGKSTDTGVGQPDFRVVDSRKLLATLRKPICWICGQPMGVHRVFTIGPMCSINRVISEPPSHRECAEFAVRACPFLANPRMRRNEKDLPEQGVPAAGFHIDRNPKATCLWETRHYRPFKPRAGQPGILFNLGDPVRVDWYCEGRPATRAEVMDSIDSGYPQLYKMAEAEGPKVIQQLEVQRAAALKLVPV